MNVATMPGLEIRTDRLMKTYRGRTVVNGVSLDVSQGEIVGLLGHNGAGKTTTFYMVVGLVRPDSGHVLLGDREVTRVPMYLRARSGIGYLPQEASVFRKLTVEQNLQLVLQHCALSPRERQSRAERLLEEFNLTSVRRQRRRHRVGDLLAAERSLAKRHDGSGDFDGRRRSRDQKQIARGSLNNLLQPRTKPRRLFIKACGTRRATIQLGDQRVQILGIGH